MAEFQIVYYPDDPLTQKAHSVESFDAALGKLVEDMLETMHAYKGVGLAAPQIGKSKRLFVLQEPDGPEICLVNPEIVSMEGKELGEEGCLSMPEVYAQVPRATEIAVKAQDVSGSDMEFEAVDFLARIIQHETDHLNGILFPQRLDIITRQEKLEEWNAVRERMLADHEGATDAS
ncbi:MAG: peptide deformylase [Candidatus Hydrogenedentota bacterium]|nr:MAG: peptide deformylase [Candidatus Hydrogenedentota bacterium]